MDNLIKSAIEMRKNARAPYSNYTVGAALLTGDRKIITGCNIESSSFSLTCCAERVAIFKAISEGVTTFKAMAVATENGGYPCGACRQVIWEQCGNIPIFTTDANGHIHETTSLELLPHPFDDSKLTS